MSRIVKVICGFQTGADQATARAANACGILTGGAMPKGFLTEDGPRPEFAAHYGAVELETSDYPTPTRAYVRDSDLTLWFGSIDSAGFKTTIGACNDVKKTREVIRPGEHFRPSRLASWLR